MRLQIAAKKTGAEANKEDRVTKGACAAPQPGRRQGASGVTCTRRWTREGSTSPESIRRGMAGSKGNIPDSIPSTDCTAGCVLLSVNGFTSDNSNVRARIY